MVRTKPAKTPNINQRLTSFKHPVRSGFRQTERKFQQNKRQLAQPDLILMRINQRFDNIDQRLDSIDQQLRALRKEMNEHFTALEDRLDRLTVRIADFLKRYLRSV